MDESVQKWNWDKSINTGNFWGALEASRADNDLSFFSNDTSPPPRKNDFNSMNSNPINSNPMNSNNNFTTYNQWSGLSFQPYSLWGSPPPTPGPETAMNRPQTQMSSVTASTSRSESPGEWNVSRNSSFGLSDPGWREDTRHSNGSVMCTYDSLSVPPWSPGVSHSINQYETSWAPVSHHSANYDQRTNYQPFPVYEKKPVIDAGFALDKLAERFQDFKLKPQILSRRISDRKIRANMKKPACIECVFCKNNEESEKVYKSHVLKDVYGRIQCPILRLYRCPICGNPGGDNAHTIRYCPKSKAHHRKLETIANASNKREKRRAV